MRIISFAYTTPALLAGRKTVTRREWDADYACLFHAGDQVAAWDKSPRYGGKQVGVIQLLQDPYPEDLADMTESDYEAEGFAYLAEQRIRPPQWCGFQDFSPSSFERWRQSGGSVIVVRFELRAPVLL